ncbi:MAG TPA: hypothetical protein DCP14_00655 [Rhodobiaceae bacterium]|nr:hypothetical protein [Rhodobiaceae bacterium]
MLAWPESHTRRSIWIRYLSVSVLVGFFEAEINGAPWMGPTPILSHIQARILFIINWLELSMPRENPIFWSFVWSTLNLDIKRTFDYPVT